MRAANQCSSQLLPIPRTPTLQIEAAATVVVVGGGSVGVEIASEVAEAHPDKRVTLVCGEGLLGRMDPKAGEFAAQWFKEHGVEVLVGERIRCGEGGRGAVLGRYQLVPLAHMPAGQRHQAGLSAPNQSHPDTSSSALLLAPAATGAAWVTGCRALPP